MFTEFQLDAQALALFMASSEEVQLVNVCIKKPLSEMILYSDCPLFLTVKL
jgi:hypothetical protein